MMLSSSYKDVAAIAPVPTQPLSKLSLLSDGQRSGGKRSTAGALLQEKYSAR